MKSSTRIALVFLAGWAALASAKINVHKLRCAVCQRTVEEMVKDVDQVDPHKRIHVGEFMLDHKGDIPQKTVELRRSEVYLTELMERVCKKMDDYVRAVMKSTGELIVIPLIVNGMMNSIVGEAEIIQDGDLNKSLKFYCENIVEEFDEGFVKHFGTRDGDLSRKICWDHSNLCKASYLEEYEEDIVAAEKRKAQSWRKKSTKTERRKSREEMTESEQIRDQIAQLPLTGSGVPERVFYEPEEEPEDESEEPHEKPKSLDVDVTRHTHFTAPPFTNTLEKDEL